MVSISIVWFPNGDIEQDEWTSPSPALVVRLALTGQKESEILYFCNSLQLVGSHQEDVDLLDNRSGEETKGLAKCEVAQWSKEDLK